MKRLKFSYRKPTLFVRLITWVFVVFFSFMFILLIKISFWEGFQIPSASMTPTFRVGDVVWVNKSYYGINWPWQKKATLNTLPRRSEVVVFTHPSTHEYYVKRVIGLPGDVVMILGRQIWVNGKLFETLSPVDEDESAMIDGTWNVSGNVHWATHEDPQTKEKVTYRVLLTEKADKSWSLSGYWTVPEGKLFVLGDLRDESSDSREWGFVDVQSLVGKATCLVDAGHITSVHAIEGRTGCHVDQKVR